LAFVLPAQYLTQIPDNLKIENYFELHPNTVWQEHYQAYEAVATVGSATPTLN
jgi:transcriptional regulatory protein LevR